MMGTSPRSQSPLLQQLEFDVENHGHNCSAFSKLDALPLIDVMETRGGEGEGRGLVVQDCAFDFQIKEVDCHGVPQSLMRQMQQLCRQFFEFPAADEENVKEAGQALGGQSDGRKFASIMSLASNWGARLRQKLLPVTLRNYDVWHTGHYEAMAVRLVILVVILCVLVLLVWGTQEEQSLQPLLQESGMTPKHTCAVALFVFGASYMDVGENAAAMPFREAAEFPPYGLDYFGKPMGRFSNGRLVIDHISEMLGQELMSPYLHDVDGTFRNGVNFASSGSTACNTTFKGDGSQSEGLFSLSVQVDQFRVFHREALAKSTRKEPMGVLSIWEATVMLLPPIKGAQLPGAKDFSRGVYIIESGNNDYLYTSDHHDLFPGEELVTSVLQHIEHAIRSLYKEGARTIVVLDAIPIGCFAATLGRHVYKSKEINEDGCLAYLQERSSLHNQKLLVMIQSLNMELIGSNIITFSIHDFFMRAIRNPSEFGLKYVHKACCGYGGGLYNANIKVQCGEGGFVDGEFVNATMCEDRSLYMLWDPVHPTDTFAHHIAKAFVQGDHMQPAFYIKETCQLPKDSFLQKMVTFRSVLQKSTLVQ